MLAASLAPVSGKDLFSRSRIEDRAGPPCPSRASMCTWMCAFLYTCVCATYTCIQNCVFTVKLCMFVHTCVHGGAALGGATRAGTELEALSG